MASEHFDHIIIGGGIVGCSIAYHLAGATDGRVLVLERNELASAASSRAAGLVLQVTGKTANITLVKATREAISELQTNLADSIGLHPVGSLRIAVEPARQQEVRALAETAATYDIPCQMLSPAEARSHAPWLHVPEDSTVAYMPTDGYIDPYLLSMAYAQAARQRGATFRPRTGVEGLVIDNDRVVGVEVPDGRVLGDTIIDAAGVWAMLVAEKAGYALPMAPVRSHYWICDPDPRWNKDHPVTVMADAGAYTRPEAGGLVLGVQEPTSKTFDVRSLPGDTNTFSPTTGEEHWDILARGAEAVEPFFPAVMEAQFSNYVAGLSAYTPDGLMLLGPVPRVSGFLVAAGCCGSGIALSAGIGIAVADLSLGNVSTFDISPFDPGRFGVVDPFSPDFRERCAAARAAKARKAD